MKNNVSAAYESILSDENAHVRELEHIANFLMIQDEDLQLIKEKIKKLIVSDK